MNIVAPILFAAYKLPADKWNSFVRMVSNSTRDYFVSANVSESPLGTLPSTTDGLPILDFLESTGVIQWPTKLLCCGNETENWVTGTDWLEYHWKLWPWSQITEFLLPLSIALTIFWLFKIIKCTRWRPYYTYNKSSRIACGWMTLGTAFNWYLLLLSEEVGWMINTNMKALSICTYVYFLGAYFGQREFGFFPDLKKKIPDPADFDTVSLTTVRELLQMNTMIRERLMDRAATLEKLPGAVQEV